MIEGGRIIGLGAAFVDAKIQSSKLQSPLPSDKSQLPEFLDAHPEADLYAGGSIPNILTAVVRLSNALNVRLLSCVGNNPRGKFFAEHTDRRLGEPRVSKSNPTGIWVGVYEKEELVEDLDFYGAAGDIVISKEELRAMRNDVFITDIDACMAPDGLEPIKQILETLADKGLFILSLSGASSAEDIHKTLASVNRMPEVVVGNTFELPSITHEADVAENIKTVFPRSGLVVVTQGKAGSVIRFKEQIFSSLSIYNV